MTTTRRSAMTFLLAMATPFWPAVGLARPEPGVAVSASSLQAGGTKDLAGEARTGASRTRAPSEPRSAAPPAVRSTGASETHPWRAHQALGTPWLGLGLEHRVRFEHLEDDFRTANPGDASGLFMRTLLSPELRFLPFVVGAEIQDSRAWTTETTPLNTTLVNPLELLRAYVGLHADGVFVPGDATSLTAGRLTLDLGSRRLVARQEFRNTVNAFTGLDLQWTSPRHDVVRTFAVMPVVRLPSSPAELRDNRAELDRENTDALFWAAFFQSRPLNARVTLEAYVLGLYERDSDIAPSSNRRLLTPGLRTLRPPMPGELDFQLEFMGQFGRSRASAAATDTADLEHLALSLHASSGFQFEVPWSPRVALQYDYASGDRAPDSNTNNRFDPLFCARRFDFGPVGLYGAIARSNVSSPGLRVEVRPHRTLDALAAYRLAWLASPRDGWTTAALRDPSGASGSFVGQQAEARVRWHMLPRNLSLEVGSAALVRGTFATRAPNARNATPVFVYTQITGTI